jgi:formylglycine-generating enzyme required for sulfatase activity
MNGGDLAMGKELPELAAEYREAFAGGRTTSVLVPCNDGFVFTAPVGSYAPNGFGLFDVLGNVWEWVEDCGDETGVNAVLGGASNTAPMCKRNFARGGSWNDWPVDLRLADSHRLDSASRRNDTGFRLVRELVATDCNQTGGRQC